MSLRTRRTLLIMSVLGLAFTTSQFYRTALAVVAPNMAADLSMSPAALGMTSGMFFLATAIMQIPCGLLFDRFGPKRVVPLLMAAGVVGTVLTWAADGTVMVVAGQTLIGAGCSGIFVGGLVIVSRWYSPRRFALIAAVMIAISNIGLFVSGTPFAALTEAIGWRGGYLVSGIVCAAIAAVYALVVRDAPPEHPWHAREPESWSEAVRGLVAVVTDRRVHPILGLALVSYAGILAIRALWGGPYLADIFNMDALARGNVLLIMSVTLTLGSLMYGTLDGRGLARRHIILAGACTLASLFAVLALQSAPQPLVISALFCLVGLAGPYSVLLIATSRGLFSDRLTGRAITVINVANFGGAGAMQIWPGFVLDAFPPTGGHPPLDAYRTVFAIIAGMIFIAALAFWRFGPRAAADERPADPAEI